MIGLAIRIALGRALNALKQLWALCLRYPWQCALAASLLAVAWLWHGKGNAEAERDAAIAAKVAQAAKFTDAMAEAERLHREARAATEKLSKEIAYATDDKARRNDADSRAAFDRWRVQPERACRATGATAAAAVPDNTEGAAGTAAGGMVAIALAHAEALRQHEVYSGTCRGWIGEMIESGLAVVE
jgi:hypothetical protein